MALGANGGFLVVEAAGGVAFHSLALLADAAHMVSDVVGLTIALVAQRLLDRPVTAKHSYGLQHAEVLAAQANGLTLVAVAGWIIFNLGSAVRLPRAQGESLNMRGAFVHMGRRRRRLHRRHRRAGLGRRLGRPAHVGPHRRARAVVGVATAARHRSRAARRHPSRHGRRVRSKPRSRAATTSKPSTTCTSGTSPPTSPPCPLTSCYAANPICTTPKLPANDSKASSPSRPASLPDRLRWSCSASTPSSRSQRQVWPCGSCAASTDSASDGALRLITLTFFALGV